MVGCLATSAAEALQISRSNLQESRQLWELGQKQTCWRGNHEIVAAEVWHRLVSGQVTQQLGSHCANIIHQERLHRIQMEDLRDAGVCRLDRNLDVKGQPRRIHLIALLATLEPMSLHGNLK